MTTETNATKAPVGRPRAKRTPLNVRNRLSIKDRDPAYHYRVVNIVDDRIEQFKEAGYEIAPATQVGDKRVDQPSTLGSASEISVGQGTKAILMRQRNDWYQEDQKSKQGTIDELEQSMKSEAASRR